MGDFKAIVPQASTNILENPQFYDNITDDWTQNEAGAGGVWTWDNTANFIGRASAKITAGNDRTSLYNDVTVENGETIYVQAMAYETTAAHAQISLYDTTTPAGRGTATGAALNEWELLEVAAWTNTTGGAVTVRVYLNNNADDSSSNVWFDAVQVEIDTTDHTTYIDGDQPGCEWNGARHNSTATRSGSSRAGGIVKDIGDDYNFDIEGVIGFGMAPRATSIDGYSAQPGGKLNNSVRTPRTFTMTGILTGTSMADFHAKRNALVDLFNPEAYPQTANGDQLVTFRYTGADTPKTIRAQYEIGLGGNRNFKSPQAERMALRFSAPDPNFYEYGNSAQLLDVHDTATLRYVAGRLKSTGQWDDLGLTSNPTTNGLIIDVCVASDKSVYYAGFYDGLDGVAGRDNIARYIPNTDTWQTLVGASDVNATVAVVKEGPDKKIYIGGSFTQVNGDAGGDADYIIVYDPATDAWEKLGVPNAVGATITAVDDMAWDSAGNLYVVGSFVKFANVANADCIAKWDGSAWAAVGATGLIITDDLRAIAIDSDDNIFVGGAALNIGGDANADYWAWWNGSAWAAVDDISLNGLVRDMTFDESGVLYVATDATNVDSVTGADYVFAWTGTAVEALGDGVSAAVYRIYIAPDGRIWITGAFATVGDSLDAEAVAIWNGSSWAPADINTPSTIIGGLAFGVADATVAENYDVYLGFSDTGSGYFSGSTTVTNNGSATAYPDFTIHRSGGTSARLVSIRNETTGKTLSCDYSLVDGETLTIYTHPDLQGAVSSFYGPRPGAILAGSDEGKFELLPGANNITAFVDMVGPPTITAFALWRDGFDGVDD
ncbi:MAG: hypothetical protein GY832_03900 [Chloroflexi bacterium]|nr:hypothetical protein [Chloroflexota bacterium]